MADRTPAEYAADLARWRGGLRKVLENGAKRLLRPGATAMRKEIAETTVGKKLWSKGTWSGTRATNEKTAAKHRAIIAKIKEKGGSSIPLIARVSRAKWEGDQLVVGWVTTGMAVLIAHGGLAKKTWIPQRKANGQWGGRMRTDIKRSFKDRGMVERHWKQVTGIGQKIGEAVDEHTRKAGL